MAHGDTREGKWRGDWQMEWVASTLHTTSEHGVSSITTTDAHTSAANSRLNWHPHQFKWTHPFCRKTKSGFCACAITFQTQSSSCGLYLGSSDLVGFTDWGFSWFASVPLDKSWDVTSSFCLHFTPFLINCSVSSKGVRGV